MEDGSNVVKNDIQLTEEQQACIESIVEWWEDPFSQKVFHVFGSAGTGKTSIAKELYKQSTNIHFMTMTGKAALRLQSKGCLGASTIHSMVYRPEELPNGDVRYNFNSESPLRDFDLVVVDECKMVANDVGHDVDYLSKKILALGDPFQLPALDGEGYFDAKVPEFLLTKPHRFALESPIFQLAEFAKQKKRPPAGQYGESQVLDKVKTAQFDQLLVESDIVLCGKNQTRKEYNSRIREILGKRGLQADFLPVAGDKLVCLKNNREKNLFNGSLWIVQEVREQGRIIEMLVSSIDEPYRVPVTIAVPYEFFNGTEDKLDWRQKANFEQFTYGYALTVHKAQGSEWNKVLVVDESRVFRENWSNHLYTAITRAAEKVTVVL